MNVSEWSGHFIYADYIITPPELKSFKIDIKEYFDNYGYNTNVRPGQSVFE